jgi:hypothetical protein
MPYEIDLTQLTIHSIEREIPFIELISHPHFDQNNYVIPSVWPDAESQEGSNCGLYVGVTAFRYGFPEAKIPPVRKHKQAILSFRKIAKDEGLTTFGEIFDVDAYPVLAKRFQLKGCESIKLDNYNEEQYTHYICDKLKHDFSLIISCDITNDGFPGNQKGLGAHWAHIFSYFHINNQCYYLVYQGNKTYYMWSAKALYDCNKQLPIENPHQFFYKTPSKKYIKLDNKLPSDKVSIVKEVKLNHLKHFRFTLCAVPTPELKNNIQLKSKVVLEAQLIHYAKKGDLVRLIELKKSAPDLSLNTKDKNGDPALIWAASKGHIDTMAWLIKNGADPKVVDSDFNHYEKYFVDYLENCIRWEKFDTIAELLKKQAELSSLINLSFDSFKIKLKEKLQSYEDEGALEKIQMIKELLSAGFIQKNDENKVSLPFNMRS